MPQPTAERRFYAASGSPYVWRVWLALEHKRLPYTLRMMSFSDGDLRTPEFAALNPRRKVPVLDEGGFVVWESAAIVEYLDDAYRDAGALLFPADARGRALARRKIREADEYAALGPRLRAWVQRIEGLPYFEATRPAHWKAAA